MYVQEWFCLLVRRSTCAYVYEWFCLLFRSTCEYMYECFFVCCCFVLLGGLHVCTCMSCFVC